MLRVAFKSLLDRKLRLLLSTSAIVMGVGFVVGSLVFTDMLQSGFDKIFSRAVGDVVVRDKAGVSEFGTPTDKTVPASLVDELSALPGVARADGNISNQSTFVIGADGKVVGGQGAPGLGLNWNDAPGQHGQPVVTQVAGRPPEREGEVALDTRTAERAGYSVGDQVQLVTSSGEQDLLSATLVGTFEFADGGTLAGASLTAFDTKTAQKLFLGGRDEFNDIWVSAADGVSQDELRDTVAAALPADDVAVTGAQEAEDNAEGLGQALSFLRTFLLVFAAISLFVGAFLIVNTFAMLLAQRSRELALLRALGASTRQVFVSVVVEAVVLGFVGATLGLGFGLLLAKALQALFAAIGLDLAGQSLVVTAGTVVAAYVIGVVVTVLAATLPAWRTRRIAPVQAMGDTVALPESSLTWRFVGGLLLLAGGVGLMALGLLGDVPRSGWVTLAGAVGVLLGASLASPVLGRPLLDVVRRLFSGLFGAVGRLAGENTRRNPRRTTATASALMIGLALAAAVAILGNSGKATTATVIEDSFAGDYVVGNVTGQPFSPKIAERVAEVDGVSQVMRQRYGFGRLDGDQTFIGAVDPDGLGTVVKVDVVEGDLADFTDGTMVVDKSFAESRDLHPGDELTIQLNERDTTFRIAAVLDSAPLLNLPATTIDSLTAAGFPGEDATLFVVADGDRLDAIEAAIGRNPLVTVNDRTGLIQQQNEQADQGLLMIYGLLALALIIAVLGIVNTLALSVIERTREIGLLRAVGMGRGQLRRMVTLESIAMALLGSVMGLVLGLFFGIAVWKAFEDDGLTELSIPVVQLAIFTVAAVVVGVLAALFPARRAAKLNVLQAIATE
jgi:putative ABC transport system permease protein